MAPRYPAVLLMEGELRKWFFSHQMWKILILKLLDSRLARVVWKDLCTHLDLHWVAPSNFPPQSQNGGAAKPQDETKVFICGSAVFEGEAVCLGLERKDGFRKSPAAQWWLLGEAAPPFTARRPRGLSHLPQTLTQLLMQLRRMGLQNKNYFCRGREWTKFHWRQINPRLNQIWTRNGDIWNNT